MRARELLKKYGIKKFISKASDEFFLYPARVIRNKFYKWKGDKYGFMEALLWSKEFDKYLRYSKILSELKKIDNHDGKVKVRILEVGAGGEGIARFLKYSGDYEKYEIVLTDINKDIKKVKLGTPIVADGCDLPFKNNTFDAVISIDVIEHIPKEKRGKFLEELKRVSKNMVLSHFVIDDPDKGFLGRTGDLKFQEWHIKNFGGADIYTAEHIDSHHPDCEEIEKIFPGASITGNHNIETWFKYATLSSMPIIGFLSGFLYLFYWRKKDDFPPFHSCFMKWTKK